MQPIYIAFGTESGNAQSLAQRAGETLEKHGLPCKVVDMLDLVHESLPSLRYLLVITSTYGNGDPPSNAEALHAWLMKKAPTLPDLAFSVCGLGDTTYERFAQCGKDFDRRLGELGATRLLDRQDCDVDYEAPFEQWLGAIIAVLEAKRDASPSGASLSSPPDDVSPVSKHVDAPGTRRNPVLARVLVNEPMNREGSTKQTRHLVLSTAALPSAYEMGDSIGIWPDNDPQLVEEILRLTKVDAQTVAKVGDHVATVKELLSRRLDVQEPDVRLIDRVLDTHTAEKRQAVAKSSHVVDLLAESTSPWTADELVHHLRPLAPRLYSIASSPIVHPGEVHLLIDIVRYELKDRPRMGVASQQIGRRAPVGSELSIYLHPAPGFRIAPPDRDIVMIGPGTGVAPFRAFLEQRHHDRVPGRSWLFFGARQRAFDFFYEEDVARWLQGGTLTRLDLAFSRDQPDKVYVQHRMLEHAADLAAWIRGGAVIYVCGDAKRMAPDVHATLQNILASTENKSVLAGAAELDAIAAAGRYIRDVY